MKDLALTIVSGPAAGGTVHLESGDEMVVGREFSADLGVMDLRMSRRHFQLESEMDVWQLRDLGSSNGTNVNGEILAETTLREGDIIVAGDTQFQVSIVNATVGSESPISNTKPDHKQTVRKTILAPNPIESESAPKSSTNRERRIG